MSLRTGIMVEHPEADEQATIPIATEHRRGNVLFFAGHASRELVTDILRRPAAARLVA
jgi:hypothetical protein